MKRYLKQIIAAVSAIILIIVLVRIIGILNVSKVRSNEDGQSYTKAVGEELSKSDTAVLVGESDRYRLLIETKSLNIIVEDKKTGKKFESTVSDATQSKDHSVLNVNYIGKDNGFLTWDAYKYCVLNDSYNIYRIDNGVRIHMNLNEGESSRFFEYMPRKMSVECYNDFFVGGIDRLIEEGSLDKALGTKYKNTLKLLYSKSHMDDFYKYNKTEAPAPSAAKQMIEVAKLVGYTRDMLLEDAETYGFKVEFVEPAEFDVTLDVFLDGDDFVAVVPASELVSKNDFYQIQSIDVLPNFGVVKETEVEEGYLFVPDGSGALMKMNTYNAKVPDYYRGFYENDYFANYFYLSEYSDELMMPVFGLMSLKGSENPFGFMAIVEDGADTAGVKAILAAKAADGVGRPYNKIFAVYDVSQYKWVRVFGEYAENQSTYLVLAPKTTCDFTVRYKLYGEDVSYFNMAKDYQKYLCGGEAPEKYLTDAEMYLEMVGAVLLQKRILGIPYNSLYSMTTYAELAEIIQSEQNKNLTVSYLGAFDGGMNNELMKDGKLVSVNGSEKELKELLSLAENRNIDLYLETDFSKVYEDGNGFSKRIHGLEDYSKSVAEVYGYSVQNGMFKEHSNRYTLLNPIYLNDVVKDFNKSVGGNYNYFLEDITEKFFASYGNDYVSPYESQRLVNQAIESMPESSKLALDNPRADKLKYGDIAVNVARRSSGYNTFYCTIPFRQLVLNGMMKYTTLEANNNSDPTKIYLLQAVETGMIPKFTLSYKNVDVLKDSTFSYYYSVQYELMKESMDEVYACFEEAMKSIGTTKIVNHSLIEKDIFRTEYANGTEVITNYTGKIYTYNGKDIEPLGYMIIENK